MIGFVVGNGESRKTFNLEKLQGRGPIYGCNALYRDFTPDVLFARDKEMIAEIKNNYNGNLAHFVKPSMIVNDIEVTIPQDLVLTGSVAIFCMAHIYKGIDIYLLGFDPFQSYSKGKNNLYKGTRNYAGPTEDQDPRTRQTIQDIQVIKSTFHNLFIIIFVHK